MEGKVHQSHTHTHTRARTHAHTHSWAQTITLWWLSASVWQTGRWEACWWRGLAQSFVILICSDHWHPSLLSYCARLYDVFIQTLMHRQLREKKFDSVKRYPNKIICFGLMIQCNPVPPNVLWWHHGLYNLRQPFMKVRANSACQWKVLFFSF